MFGSKREITLELAQQSLVEELNHFHTELRVI